MTENCYLSLHLENTTFLSRHNHQAELQTAFDSVAGGCLYPLTPVVLLGVTMFVCDVLAVLSFNFFVFTAAMARVNKRRMQHSWCFHWITSSCRGSAEI